VLPYLPTHLSIEAIAERLGRSRSTVKTHLAHIYEKLGATTRAEAVNRARELGLLAPERNPTAVAPKETLTASRR
jgi:LuxR family maltose regulon positive regulatory protein